MSFIKSVLAIFLTLAIAGLCILNKNTVDVFWSPLHEPYNLPLYAIILAALSIGFFVGAFTTWINQAHLRKQNKDSKKEIKMLEKELSRISEHADKNTNQDRLALPPKAKPFSDFFPALPYKGHKK